MDFSVYSGFLHQYNWSPRYKWNIVESGFEHHKPQPQTTKEMFVVSFVNLISQLR
jgi:hypothetical protein